MKRITHALSMVAVLVGGVITITSWGATSVQAQQTITVADAWVREPMAKADQTAAFLVLENTSSEPRKLVSVSAPGFDKAELHTMSMNNGMMRMTPVKDIDIPAHGKAELKPGSLHIMLFGVKQRPASGSTVDLTLNFDNGQSLPVKATVRTPDGMR